jgi:hypothetical protein
MVLEHEGVALQSIARDEKMSPAAVRARVYRLRRTLRKELAYLLCGALVFGGGAEALHAWFEPIGSVAPVAPSLPEWALGELVVSHVDVADDVDAATLSLLRSLEGASVVVDGGTVHLGPVTLAARVTQSESGEKVTLTSASGAALTASVEHTGDTVTLASSSGAVRGRLVLRRLE